ncbi:copia protein [Tanacetum coccineum]
MTTRSAGRATATPRGGRTGVRTCRGGGRTRGRPVDQVNVRLSKVKMKNTPWRLETSRSSLREEVDSCGDPNHLIGECPKPPKDKNQRAFVGGYWSDSCEEEDEKVKDETCLICLGVDLEPDEWIKDSRCSKHMTGNQKLLSSYKAYNEVARLESIRILLAYACALDFKLFQMDVKSAFLNGFINEEVYVAQPPGFIDFEKPDHVYKLKKALYGLKQAPKAWYDRLKAFLIKHEYKMGMAPRTSHLEAVKRIFRYIKGTTHLGFWYPKGTDIKIVVYADSDHAGDYVDLKSTSGICTLVGCCLTSWFSKKQIALAISTTIAKYISVGKACQQALWMNQALIDYDIRLDDVPIIQYQINYSDEGQMLIEFVIHNQFFSYTLEEFAQILDIPCEGACVFTEKWSLDELAYGVPRDGPYRTNPPSPDDIISYIRNDQEGPKLVIESYVLYDRVMNPLTAQQERKTGKDCGTRRCRHSTSSSSAFDQPSSSHLNDDDDDGNDEGTSHASTPSLTCFVTSLTNEVPQVF